jgi:hypothetical protein
MASPIGSVWKSVPYPAETMDEFFDVTRNAKGAGGGCRSSRDGAPPTSRDVMNARAICNSRRRNRVRRPG